MKTIIYIVRHGEVYNPHKILYGRLPGFPLSEKGNKTIQKLAIFFKNKDIKFIYSSPMLRTYQTASILGDILGIKPKISRLIIETKDIHAGMKSDIFNKTIEPFLYDKKYIKLGQESISSQEKRMFKFISKILKLHLGKNIIVVSHGDPIMILRAKLENQEFTYQYKKSHYINKGDYFILEINDKYKWIK